MSKSNVVHPEGAPITSQPESTAGSEAGSRPGTQEGEMDDSTKDAEEGDGVMLPTPTKFLPPKDCPAGLECMVELSYAFMKQSFAHIDDHPDTATKYEVLTVFGHRIFVVIETKAPVGPKIFCAGGAPFSLAVFSRTSETSEKFQKEVLQISGHSGSFGRGAEIEIKYDKKKLGRVEQDSDFSILRYTIQNAEGKDVLKIVGPKHGGCCSMTTMAKVLVHEFDIFLADGHSHVGRIAKHWSGVPNNKDVFTRSDIWGVKFPEAYDVKLKCLLMSTCFLMMYQTPLSPPPKTS